MKKNIHPKYYSEAKVTCQCGHTFVTGSTQPSLHVDICSACHPFFSGSEDKFINKGRVDRFRAKVAAAEEFRKKKIAAKDKKIVKA